MYVIRTLLSAAVCTALVFTSVACGDDGSNVTTELICDDTVDDDDDGLTDCDDPDCDADPSCAPTTCDLGGSCDACIFTSCTGDDLCAAELDQCFENNPECDALDVCMEDCAEDEVCEDQCMSDHPDGVADITALYTCVLCDACAADCAGNGAGLCQ